jgi:PAS domain S-box-containing protein
MKTLKLRLSTRLIFGVVLIEVIMLSILVWNSVRLISSSHAERMEIQVKQDAILLANSLAPGLAAADRAILLDVLSLLREGTFVYVGVYDKDGYLLAKRGNPPETISIDLNFENAQIDGIYDSEASINLGGQSLGKVRVGVSLEEIETLIASTRFQNTTIAFVEIILSITFTLLLALVVTRHLRKLEEGAQALARGELNHRINIESTDEIGDLAHGFNKLATHLSITQEKLQKEHKELERKENELSTIIDNIPSMLFVKDAKELRFQRFNKAGEELLSKSENILIGLNDYDLFPQDQARYFTENDRKVLNSDEILDIPEEAIDTPHGRRYLHTRKVAIKDDTGNPLFLLGISEDITERKESDKKLSASEEKLRLAMDAAQDGIWDWNVTTGEVDYSTNWSQLLGERELAQDYSSWAERIHPDDKDRIFVSLDAHLRGKSDYWQEEHRLKHKDGSWKWVFGKGRVVERDTDGQPLRMVGTMIDISRQKILEEELQNHRINLESLVAEKTEELHAAKNEAERANREKSEFLANMSHELRTPMHSILSFASLALKRAEDDKTKRFLQNIRTSGIRLTDLLNDLLDLSKLESGKMECNFIKQDMTTLIQETIIEVSSLLSDKKISIKLNTDEHFECAIDQRLITRVLINLFSNAIKFSPENSIITVDIKIMVLGYKEYAREIIQVSVSDQGIGIPEDQLTDIFNKFVQSSKTKSNSGGTGLGLSISKEIIELHGGKIWAESSVTENDSGSVFTFYIPVSQKFSKVVILESNEAINYHQSFKSNLLNMISSKMPAGQIPSFAELDDQSCPLTPWINSMKGFSKIEELKKYHEDFHSMAGEIMAYYQDGNELEVTKHLLEFILISEKMTDLLENYSTKD